MSSAEFTSFLAAAFKHLAAHSVPGSVHFQCIDWLLVEAQKREEYQEYVELMLDYKMKADQAQKRARYCGMDPPEFLPDPAHIIFDARTGKVEIKGPITLEEKALSEKLRSGRQAWAEEVQECEKDLLETPDDPNLLRWLERARSISATIEKTIELTGFIID